MAASEGSVLITGAGSGMGRLAARDFAAKGVPVAALDVDADGLLETAAGRQNIRTFEVDVTDYEAVAAAVAATEAGLGPLRRVYSAAAIAPLGRIEDQSVDVIQRVMTINYGGVVNVAKATLPRLLQHGSGVLINFASLAGWIPTLYMAAYSASKFAVVAFTEVLAHEHRDSGVKVLCVCPPPVRTPMLDQIRATVWPKIFDEGPPIEAQEVLDAIEGAIGGDSPFVFPGRGSTTAWRLRRWLPGLLWKRIHAIESA